MAVWISSPSTSTVSRSVSVLRRIVHETAREALAGEVRRPAERVSDADVARARSIAGLAIHRKSSLRGANVPC